MQYFTINFVFVRRNQCGMQTVRIVLNNEITFYLIFQFIAQAECGMNGGGDCRSSQWMTSATDRVRLHSIEFGCFVSPESFYGWKNFPHADVNNRLLNNSLARPHSHTAPFAAKTIWSISDWPALGICVSDGTTEFAVHWAQIKFSLHLARAPGDIGPEVIESSRQQQAQHGQTSGSFALNASNFILSVECLHISNWPTVTYTNINAINLAGCS